MLHKIYNRICPPTCILCDSTTATSIDLCRECFDMLPHNLHCCYRCALPLPSASSLYRDSRRLLCGGCLTSKPLVTESHIPFRYEIPVDYIVQQLKYRGSQKYGRLIGELLAASIPATSYPDLLVPVPQHRDRYLQRGFNHAELIAQTAGQILAIPVDKYSAVRLDARPQQSSLNAAARRLNMRGAFKIIEPSISSHIAIVDDVVTTGATTQALAKALLGHGCRRISIWAFARTP